MHLTLAKPEHMAEIRALDAAEFEGAPFPEGSTFWVMERPDMGYCAAEIRNGVLHLTRAWVAPEHRGRGWQRRMVSWRLTWGRVSHGCTHAETYTWWDNIPSMRALIRAGFQALSAREPGWITWSTAL